MHGLSGCQAPGSPEFNSGPVGLSVHAGQLSTYSEINISGRHSGSACILLNLRQATRTKSKGAWTSSAVSVGITDEAGSGTVSLIET